MNLRRRKGRMIDGGDKIYQKCERDKFPPKNTVRRGFLRIQRLNCPKPLINGPKGAFMSHSPITIMPTTYLLLL